MNYIHLLNLISVGIFGMILSASFCNIIWTWQKKLVLAGNMAVILLFQGMIYFWINSSVVEIIYPFITHLPLIIILFILSRKFLWSVIAVLTAYLCCQLRRWLALLIVAIFSGNAALQDTAELILTLPILLLLLRLTSSSIRSVSHYTVFAQIQFGLVPALYYGFDYLTRIYTNLLLKGALVAVEFMPFVCSVAYLVFVVHVSESGQIRSRLEQTQELLNLQIEQAVREIKALRASQQKTKTYRHDLRHHMQYISSCIENKKFEQAQKYILEICSEIEKERLTAFCENEAANLIFSAFSERARNAGISMKINAAIPPSIPILESDLCVLLSNALENALHACQQLDETKPASFIEVTAYQQKSKLFIQIINSCDSEVMFNRGVPVTNTPGHGLGVRSICAIVDKYGGMYHFSLKDGTFILRVSF